MSTVIGKIKKHINLDVTRALDTCEKAACDKAARATNRLSGKHSIVLSRPHHSESTTRMIYTLNRVRINTGGHYSSV